MPPPNFAPTSTRRGHMAPLECKKKNILAGCPSPRTPSRCLPFGPQGLILRASRLAVHKMIGRIRQWRRGDVHSTIYKQRTTTVHSILCEKSLAQRADPRPRSSAPLVARLVGAAVSDGRRPGALVAHVRVDGDVVAASKCPLAGDHPPLTTLAARRRTPLPITHRPPSVTPSTTHTPQRANVALYVQHTHTHTHTPV